MLDLGCYCTSTMRLLAGREPLRVAALRSMRGDVDATLTGMLDFGEGLTGQFLCSFETARSQGLALLGAEGRLALDWPFSTATAPPRSIWTAIWRSSRPSTPMPRWCGISPPRWRGRRR